MTHDQWNHHRREDENTRHSKDDALSETEFEKLWTAGQEMDGYQGDEAEFVMVAAGRLGLRVGEIAHLRESWLNWSDQLLSIPSTEPCESGRDGGRCGSCEQHIDQKVTRADDLTRADIEDDWWQPKTQAAARTIPWDWCPRAEMVFQSFFDCRGRYPHSVGTVGRRVQSAAERATTLDSDSLYPHALRATAAMYHAGKGLNTHALCAFMGWAGLQTAEAYVAASAENTQRAIRSLHSR